ncbi:MAG: xanthine dehydrogenase family protein molybdopterin-binding subunit [Planctomycetes bacterium]|nr:xanthine dehydrogenase family protein molybdopterin-binding subunit [Planctomycetota bacterium]
MGLGYALTEEFVMERGINRTNLLSKCGVPTIDDTLDVDVILVEDPEPEGPFGAKGISEVGLIPTVPAITNAIYNAVGARIKDLPAKKERVLAVLREKGRL